MASKGSRPKPDHESRAKRQKPVEEPLRPKTHWDHVLEEMLWLSKDFESERKFKLALAKRVALRASKGMVDQATKGEKKLKEEEQRLKKVALNISKDVKKFWLKIEKLVLYKHQMEIDVKKKKALDKQLEFLLGQTERYSTMLAENLVDNCKPAQQDPLGDCSNTKLKEVEEDNNNDSQELDAGNQSDAPSDSANTDEDSYNQSDDESEDDEKTIEEDEALITKEERQEELDALQNEVDLPLEELLKRYTKDTKASEDCIENCSVNEEENELVIKDSNHAIVSELSTARNTEDNNSITLTGRRCNKSNGTVQNLENHLPDVVVGENNNLKEVPEEIAKQPTAYDFDEEGEDGDFILAATEEKDDEATLSEEEEFAKAEASNPTDEISLLQKESEISIEELLARYKKDSGCDEDFSEEDDDDDDDDDDHDGSDYASALSDGFADSPSTNEPPGVTLEEDIDQKQNSESINHSQQQPISLSPTEEETNNGMTSGGGRESEDIIADAAAAARSAQPTGNTLSTTKVRTKVPFFLKFPLREYQHIGLDWLVTMYEKRLNGILADEMGLGKTIMTIALLAHLACEKGIWGPHLIVVPTSVMLNWETEFLKWCPAFKILTYFGSAKERKLKRQGWLKPNSFHICITTYRLVIQDSKIFKRKKWRYLILDEAHLIKNWKSQRWQTLLNFNSKRRILLTGTPLQNDLMELWSLMHFLMPHVFQSHQEFKDWFCNPITGMVEGQEKVNKEVVDRLHNVLRPFLLRRLKRDVEKQLPMKKEHVIYCRLSRRQRNLYEDFIASSETQATLSSANFFAMISVIMQLRKVCNHPDLFEGRPIVSSFDMPSIETQFCSSLCLILEPEPFSKVDLIDLGLMFTHLDYSMNSWESDEVKALAIPSNSIQALAEKCKLEEIGFGDKNSKANGSNIFEKIRISIMEERLREAKERSEAIAWWNSIRCERKPVYSTTLRALVTVVSPVEDIHRHKANPISYIYSTKLADVILSPVERFQKTVDLVEGFMFAIPAARAPPPIGWCSKSGSSVFLHPNYKSKCTKLLSPLTCPFRPAIIRRQVYFPDRRLIQFDCGKLQELSVLLRRLKYEGHRALIFTQMTKMLDVLEAFINLYGYTYMRLDGSTPPEERQTLMQRFNTNPKIFLFILSTRSGGVGINLVGADTVIFYDSDWNPAMDLQAQDRCHRIGQTREVHIYRLISESTIEENILKKANQKRALDDLVIQSGGYNTEFFKKLDPMELFTGHRSLKNAHKENEVSPSNADVEAALKHAEDEADYMALKKVEQEEEVENQEFTEEAIERGEDDELANEDDAKVDELASQCVQNGLKADESNATIEEKVLAVANIEDDSDMLADVKQMAEAAIASGQEISSFENKLRPIDRYAVRFLELWDPIIDKNAVETQVRYEEAEWELDRLERYKEEMEADIDEDEEPFVYETWDADFATEAYRQQVEVLAQHQLIEDQEFEARQREEEAENERMRNSRPIDPKPKSKKKQKKARFKSLKKGSLASESKSMKDEQSMDAMSDDEDTNTNFSFSDSPSPRSFAPKKRKKPELIINSDEENTSKKKPKKSKKAPGRICSLELDTDFPIMPLENYVEIEQKPAGKSKMGGKISITSMPVKRVLMIKPEKLKKGSVWSRDCVPSPDVWLPQEDAILCAVVHEYGPHWNLVSDILYGMTAGGFYRGRYRHPVHCCERYRELIQRYVLSAPDNPNGEKVGNLGSGKALLKVTEDNVRAMLDIASEQPDTELLLQRHFTALLSSVWKLTHRSTNERSKKLSLSRRSLSSINQTSRIPGPTDRITFPNPVKCSRLLKAMLHEVDTLRNDDTASSSFSSLGCREDSLANAECLELVLEFPRESDDSLDALPSAMNLSVIGLDSRPVSIREDDNEDLHFRSSCDVAENRFRASARACADDNLGWAFSVFPTNDLRSRSAPKQPSLGKHKLALLDLNKPSKATKFKRASPESSEPSVFLSPPLENLNIFRPVSPFLEDIQIDDAFSDIDSYFIQETEPVETVDHNYVPSCIFDLDDLTDIG